MVFGITIPKALMAEKKDIFSIKMPMLNYTLCGKYQRFN